jgi:hypothetical protein
VTSGEEWRRRVRRVRADRAAAKRRHPASRRTQPDRPGMLRAVPAQPHHQPPSPAATPTEESPMPNPASPTADDHRTQLRALLAQAGEYAAALDEIAHDDPRRLPDVARQLVHWHGQLAAVLFGIVGTPGADRGVTVADALTAVAEAAALSHANPISPWEHAARLFDPQAPGQDEA